MPYGALVGAVAGLGIVVVRWRVKPGVFGEIEPRRFIPDEPLPAGLPAEPWGPAGVYGAMLGAIVGAGVACIGADPDSLGQVGVLFALVGLAGHVRQVLHVSRAAPAIGEAPPDTEHPFPTRIRHAWQSLGLAGVGLAMAAHDAGWL